MSIPPRYDPHMGVSSGSWHSHNIREQCIHCEVIGYAEFLAVLKFCAICSLLTAMCCFIRTLQMVLRYDKVYVSVMKISRQQ